MANFLYRAGGLWAALVACAALAVVPAAAQEKPAPPASSELTERCPGLVAGAAPRVVPVAFEVAALADGEVRLTYVGHSTFLIESPRLVRIATDYNDYVRPMIVPDIVTMNHAHSTHYTDHPDPSIKLVLRGWTGGEKPARIDSTLGDVRVRNVPTNIRSWGDG